jgi:hypothetical protein
LRSRVRARAHEFTLTNFFDVDHSTLKHYESATQLATTPARRAPVRRIQVRKSGVHGRGVFAVVGLGEGELVLEYIGEVISWQEAQRRHPHDPANPSHTFYFHIDDTHVIDGKCGGNSTRWINHSCAPNCEADVQGGRIFIKTLRAIEAGEELNYDYGLLINEPHTKALLAQYPCWCGSPKCRGTLLAPMEEIKKKGKKKAKGAKKDKQKLKKKHTKSTSEPAATP